MQGIYFYLPSTPLFHAAVEKAVEDKKAGAGQQVDEDHSKPGKKKLEFHSKIFELCL